MILEHLAFIQFMCIIGLPGIIIVAPGCALSEWFNRREMRAIRAELGTKPRP